ncbi:hypothetical protein KSP39_PZI014121 [Platanthera zijinensis]|uniref:Uncharacterized protein n=1 Tax=Platanthera zijinensis TaxID=2320716 RepID=A0AAP0G439_9ASPA
MDPSKERNANTRRPNVIYFLNRNGFIEQLHLIRVHDFCHSDVHLRDATEAVTNLKDSDIPSVRKTIPALEVSAQAFSFSATHAFVRRSLNGSVCWKEDGDEMRGSSMQAYVRRRGEMIRRRRGGRRSWKGGGRDRKRRA